ncbi:MAG TPA: FkbM family methyltransferase [Pirellulales bacterium]|nr:FkbM family methyltransferase [Pirellulales bacterium]
MFQSDLIYDVGMNNGDDTAFYLERGYRVVGIEADPVLAGSCAERFSSALSDGRLEIVNVAVAPTEGRQTFYVCEGKSEWSSFDISIASKFGRKCHAIEVECRRFGDILGQYGVPYYLKVDIEGCDRVCLDAITREEAPPYLSVEISGVDDLSVLRGLGYQRFKIIRQNDHRQLRFEDFCTIACCLKVQLEKARRLRSVVGACANVKRPIALAVRGARGFFQRRAASEDSGGAAGARFPAGSSGPFAEETDGEWQSFEEAALCWLGFQRLGKHRFGPVGSQFWFDVHAALESAPSFSSLGHARAGAISWA